MSYHSSRELEAISAYKLLPSLAFAEDLPLPSMIAADGEIEATEPIPSLLQTSVSIQIDAAHVLARQGMQPLADELLKKGLTTSMTCEQLIDNTSADTAEFVADHCYNGLQRNALYYYRQPGALTTGRTADTAVQAGAYNTITREIVSPLIEMGIPDDRRLGSAMATQRNKLLVLQLLNRMQAYEPTNEWAVVVANKREQYCDLLQNRMRQPNGFNLKIMLDGGDFVPLAVRGSSYSQSAPGMVPADARLGTVLASKICGGAEAWAILRSMNFEANGLKLFPDQAELIHGATQRLIDQLVSLEPVQKTTPDTERSLRGTAALSKMIEQGQEAGRY